MIKLSCFINFPHVIHRTSFSKQCRQLDIACTVHYTVTHTYNNKKGPISYRWWDNLLKYIKMDDELGIGQLRILWNGKKWKTFVEIDTYIDP